MLNVPGSFFDRWSVYFTHPSSPWDASITPRRSSSARSSCSGLTFATATTVTSSTLVRLPGRAAGGPPPPRRRAAARLGAPGARSWRSRAGAPLRAAPRRGRSGRGSRERGVLGVDVERCLPTCDAQRRLRLEHLARLGLGLGVVGGGARLRPLRPVRLVERERALADPVVQAARSDVRERPRPPRRPPRGRSRRCRRSPPFAVHSLPVWRRLRRKTMAPSRPAIFPEQLGLVLSAPPRSASACGSWCDC